MTLPRSCRARRKCWHMEPPWSSSKNSCQQESLRRPAQFGQGHDRQFQAVARAGLVEDALQVALDGVLADSEFAADVLVLQSARDERRDLAFPFGKPFQV